MIVVKDVTSILKMERITTENKAKSSLIRSVSHELRTPVNGIMLLVDCLMQDAHESWKENLAHIKTCAELLKYQISDILDYNDLISNSFTLNKGFCNLKDCLQESMNFVIFQAKLKKIDIRARIDSLIPNECFTDSYRIQKIVINLLTNAIKYTTKGCIELCAINKGIYIEISIRDTGIGIHQDRISQIFDMFSDKDNGMSGLGLHISNRILTYFGSCMKVFSKEGEGSLFVFCLDIIGDMPKIELSDEIDTPYEVNCTLEIPYMQLNIFEKYYPKVLIVDDNDFNRLLLGNILKRHGIPYIEAINGEMAVKIIIKLDLQGIQILCIIMDCDMPVMDG